MGRICDVVVEAHANFNSAAWEPSERAYGLFQLLVCRGHMEEELSKLKVGNHLKSMNSRQCEEYREQVAMKASPSSPGSKSCSTGTPPREEVPKPEWSEDSDLSEGEPREIFSYENWGRGRRGAWWRVRDSLTAPVVVRAGVSLSSVEIRRLGPGDVIQQAGVPRSLGKDSYQGSGCIRMPIRPSGWITADATRAGGPQCLVRANVPRWRVVATQQVLVRSDEALDSEIIGMLSHDDIIDQDGSIVHRPDGIIRMPAVSSAIRQYRDTAAVPEGAHRYRAQDGVSVKITGWVTVDASAAGGPSFFEPMEDAERAIATKRRNARHRAGNPGHPGSGGGGGYSRQVSE